MSVQFDPMTSLSPIHLGRWWIDERRVRYPVTEERPPLEPTLEQFTAPQPVPAFNFRLMTGPVTPAVWFLKNDRTELLQIQRDRFTRNWAKKSDDEQYPSYDRLWPAFERDYSEFSEFLEAEGIGHPSLNQCELTYVNPISLPSWQVNPDLTAVLAPWTGATTEGFLPEAEDVQVAIRYTIPDPQGQPAGRLYVKVDPAVLPDKTPALVMTLSARGRPLGPGLVGTKAFLDLGHEWIVRGFTSLTTETMHAEWGRLND
jgi:uncharacterized protein (TIGR04255 family)